MDEHMAAMQALQSDFAQARDMFEEQKALLEQRLAEAEERYKNRESRPEDVMRIKKLAELCQEKDAALAKAADEMKFFKLELINREENFNKMFNRSPHVGVMQVVKTKGGIGAGAGAGVAGSGKRPPGMATLGGSARSMASAAAAGADGLPPLGAPGGGLTPSSGGTGRSGRRPSNDRRR